MKRRALSLALALLGTSVWANDAWLEFRGEPAFEAAYWGSVMEGRAPSLAFPLFGAELPAAGTELGWAGPKRGLSLSLSTPSLWYDTPFTSISQISSPLAPGGGLPVLPELQRAIGELPYLFEISFEYELGSSLAARWDLEIPYRRDWLVGEKSTFGWESQDWTTGLLGDNEFPRKSWVSYGTPGLGLALGRFPSGIGAGQFGSVLLNPEALYYDQLRLHLGGDRLRLVWMLGTSSAFLSEAEAAVQWRRVTAADVPPDHSQDFKIGGSYWNPLDDHDYSGARNALKLFGYHLLEWRPWDFLRLGIAEQSTMGGTTPSLNFFLPTLFWHNTYQAGYANVAIAGLFSLVPYPGLLISGEFLLDDAKAGDDPSYSKPTSLAWQGSASYSFIPQPGTLLSFGAEGTHVDRWTYVRWQPYQTPYQRQILPGGSRGIDYPLGSTYGPDSDQVGLWARFRTRSGASLELSWERVRKGPIYMGMIDANAIPIYYDYDTFAGAGKLALILAKPDEIRHIVAISGNLPLGACLSARLAASLGFYENYGHIEGVSERLAMLYLGFLWKPLP